MDYTGNWTDLRKDLVIDVSHRLSFLEEFVQFTAVCKSWKSATEAHKPLWLPTRCPMLLLAEEVAPGAIRSNYEYDKEYSDSDEEEEEEEDDDDDDVYGYPDPEYAKHLKRRARYVYSRNLISSSRGLYSLSSMKTYNIELPAGRLIFGTNKGWLVTLGRDLEVNILHPLLRHQISLPPMLTFPRQYEYDEDYTPEEETEQFIRKVAMSSKLLNKSTDVSFSYHRATLSLIVMAVYANLDYLGFARLGDKV